MPKAVGRRGWTAVAFGDVVKLSTARVKDPRKSGLERFVGLEHIEPGDLKIQRWGYISSGTTFTSVFRPNQVLFGKRRAYQRKIAVPDFSGVCSGDIYVLEPKNAHLVPELLPFICQTDGFFDHAVGTSAGSLSPRTSWKSLATFEFALPPLDEQRRIAAVLLSADGIIDSLQRLIATTESCIESTLEWHLGLQLLGEPHRESKTYGGVPDDWVEAPLNQSCDLITDGEHVTPPRTASGVPLLSARNVLNRRLDLRDVDFVSQATFERIARRVRPKQGDLLLSCSGTIGRVCEVPPDLAFHMVRSVALIRPNSNLLNHRFLGAVLRSRFGQRQIQSLVGQTAQGNLFQGAIGRIMVPVLSSEKQLRISREIDAQTETVSALNTRLDAARSYRTAFLDFAIGIRS
jgi:type I restriction enzyme, S subunit